MTLSRFRHGFLTRVTLLGVTHAMTAIPCLGMSCPVTGEACGLESETPGACTVTISCETVSACGLRSAEDPGTRDRAEACTWPLRCDPTPGCPVWCATPADMDAAGAEGPPLRIVPLDAAASTSPESLAPRPVTPPPRHA